MSDKRKKILIICSSFPPQTDVGGLRPAMVAKYLSEFGWDAYVLTHRWPEGDPCQSDGQEMLGLPFHDCIHRVTYGTLDAQRAAGKRNLMGRFRSLCMPETAHPCGLMDKLLTESERLWPGVVFAAAYATSPDLYPLAVARVLYKRAGTPWVADLRDIAEQEEGMPGSIRWRFLRWRVRTRRNFLMKSAALVTVVSRTHARIIQPQFRGPVQVVYNGYDFTPSSVDSANACSQNVFRIIYVGRLLNVWYRDPRVLFSALDRLLISGHVEPKDMVVEFYGTEKTLLETLVAPFRCKTIVRLLDRVPHQHVAAVLRSASVLLVLTNRQRKGILTTKLFEYLPMGQPILCVPGDGDELDNLLRETGAGVSGATAEAVASTLSFWYSEWKQKRRVSLHRNSTVIEGFSRKRQTQVLAEAIEKWLIRK